MKMLTDAEIYDKFRKVCPERSNWINYHNYNNTIQLDGHFASDELREIARVMDEVFNGTPVGEEKSFSKIS